MNIPIKEDEIILTPEQQERMYWAQLKYDSHKWIEYHKGYYKCEFCDSIHTSMLSFENVNICKKNPNLFPTDNQTPNLLLEDFHEWIELNEWEFCPVSFNKEIKYRWSNETYSQATTKELYEMFLSQK
jgi:hypothetical protein